MTATQSARKKRRGRLGVDLPMGWYQVGWADELAPGAIKPIQALGEDYVLYRGESGDFHMMEAFCGHMGAHLGYGGHVVDDCVVCPYHGWKWAKSGEVVDIPYSGRLNRSQHQVTWPVRVVSGLVFGWYHPHGKEPLWDDPMPALPEHERADYYPIWPYAARQEDLHGHPQFVVENQVDAAHFVHVHKWNDYVPLDGYGADGHCFTSMARGKLNTKRGQVEHQVKIQGWGVGIVISRHSFDFGSPEGTARERDEVTTICTTPTAPGRSLLYMTSWLPREPGDLGSKPSGKAAVLLRAGHREVFEHDWQIWDHMRYAQRPAYTHEEARVFSDVRRWTEQYYVEPVDDDPSE